MIRYWTAVSFVCVYLCISLPLYGYITLKVIAMDGT